MKLIIAGGRDQEQVMLQALAKSIEELGFGDQVTEVVSGGATGADALGESWADWWGIPVTKFLPDWASQGKAAGPIRNRQMAEYGDVLILIWDGKSRGSASMKREMEKLGKPIYEVLTGG